MRGILHAGDNDSTGAIGGAWFGAFYGFDGVYEKNYREVEDNGKLRIIGEQIYQAVCNWLKTMITIFYVSSNFSKNNKILIFF